MNNFKMTNCRTCGMSVSKDARTCPHCGARNPNKALNVTVFVLIFVFAIFFVLMLTSLSKSSSDTQPNANTGTSSEQKQTTEETPEPVQYIEITAEDLWTAYQENEVNADLLYKNKLLAVTGTVADIGKDMITDAPCVSLDSSNWLYPIQCFFPKSGSDTEALAALSDGASVTIYGKCTGVNIVYVQLSKCSLKP